MKRHGIGLQGAEVSLILCNTSLWPCLQLAPVSLVVKCTCPCFGNMVTVHYSVMPPRTPLLAMPRNELFTMRTAEMVTLIGAPAVRTLCTGFERGRLPLKPRDI